MSGSIRRDVERGTWLFVVDTTRPDGTRSQMRRRGFATKKQASEAMAAVVSDQARGSFVRPSRTTLRDFLMNEWLPAKLPTLKPSTAASYRQMISSYVVPHVGALELSKIDGGVLNTLYGILLENGRTGASGRSGGLAPKTVRNLHGMLHHAFKDAVRWRRLGLNPCDAADQPRKNEPEMKVWSGEQIRTFMASLEGDRLASIWHLLLTTGMRRGELLGLRWSDLDLASGRLTIRSTMTMVDGVPQAGTPKTKTSSRTVSIDPRTAAGLKGWKKIQTAERLLMGSGWLDTAGVVVTEPDGSPVHPQVFSRRFKAHAARAGLPEVRLHDTRHSYATAALTAGVPVKVLSQRLGHADIGVTLKIYAHVMPGDDEAAAVLAANAIMGFL